jgi:uncharacterized membrane protein YdjX (TVP38/TMEM64 family)
MKNQGRRWKWPLGYGVLLLAVCLLLYYYHDAHRGIARVLHFFSNRERLKEFIDSFGWYAPLVFIGIQALQVVAAPIPGELTGFLGGYLFGMGPGLAYSTIGMTLGSLLAFLVARRLGMPFVSRFAGQENLQKFDQLMQRQGAFLCFLLFLIPGIPKDYLCYLLGLSPLGLFPFLVISTFGRFPSTLLLTMQGQAVRSEDYRLFFVALGVALIIIVLAVIYRGQIERWLKAKRVR